MFIAANQVSSSSVEVKWGVLHNDELLGVGGHTSREKSSQCVVTSEGNTGSGQLQIYWSFAEEQHSGDMALYGHLSKQEQGSFIPYKGRKILFIFMRFY